MWYAKSPCVVPFVMCMCSWPRNVAVPTPPTPAFLTRRSDPGRMPLVDGVQQEWVCHACNKGCENSFTCPICKTSVPLCNRQCQRVAWREHKRSNSHVMAKDLLGGTATSVRLGVDPAEPQ